MLKAAICPPGQEGIVPRQGLEEIDLPTEVSQELLKRNQSQSWKTTQQEPLSALVESYLPTIDKAGWEVISIYEA